MILFCSLVSQILEKFPRLSVESAGVASSPGSAAVRPVFSSPGGSATAPSVGVSSGGLSAGMPYPARPSAPVSSPLARICAVSSPSTPSGVASQSFRAGGLTGSASPLASPYLAVPSTLAGPGQTGLVVQSTGYGPSSQSFQPGLAKSASLSGPVRSQPSTAQYGLIRGEERGGPVLNIPGEVYSERYAPAWRRLSALAKVNLIIIIVMSCFCLIL